MSRIVNRNPGEMWVSIKKYAFEFCVATICIASISLLVAGLQWRTHWLAYELFVPTTAVEKPLSTLVVLHGRSGDTITLRNWLGLDEFAEKHGFMVIYPQSHQDGWDFGVGIRERGHVGRRHVDHTRYVLDIVDEVGARYPIDRSRLFVVGVSDGASMAVHMSCVEPEVFRGLVSVAATIPYYAVEDCSKSTPLSVLLMHGVKDTIMPWEGVMYKQYKVFLSMAESIDWWLSRNGCNGARAIDQVYQRLASEVDMFRIDDCQNDTEVVVYRINDGGHTWPGRDHPRRRTSGHVNRDIDATQVITEWISHF